MGYPLRSISSYLNDDVIVGCSTDNVMHIFDMKTKKINTLKMSHQDSMLHQRPDLTVLSADTRTAVTVSKHQACVWNLPQGTPRRTIPNPFVGSQDAFQGHLKSNEGFFGKNMELQCTLV